MKKKIQKPNITSNIMTGVGNSSLRLMLRDIMNIILHTCGFLLKNRGLLNKTLSTFNQYSEQGNFDTLLFLDNLQIHVNIYIDCF